MDAAIPADVLLKALRKSNAALQGLRRDGVVIGALARHAWGSKKDPADVELLIPTGEAERESVFGALRGEGLQNAPDGAIAGTTLRLRYPDPKAGVTADVRLIEASTPFHKQAIARAKPGSVLQMQVQLISCEDLILLSAADRDLMVELLRWNAARIDGAYLKKTAEGMGVFDAVKAAWQAARTPT